MLKRQLKCSACFSKPYALILFIRRIYFVMLNKAFCGILLHSSSAWMKIFFACGSAIDRLEGLVPVPISMSWRLAFGKHTLVCLQWKSSVYPDHLKHVHLQGLTALFHSIFPNFQWCLSHQFYSGVYVCRISIFFFNFNCNLFWTMLFHQAFFAFEIWEVLTELKQGLTWIFIVLFFDIFIDI